MLTSARSTEAIESCFSRPVRHCMTTWMRESCPVFLTKWRGKVRAGQESRGTKHGLYGRSVRRGCARLAPSETVAGPLRPPTSYGFHTHNFPVKKSMNQCQRHRQPFTAGLTTSAVSRKKGTHAEKGERSRLHKRGNFLYCVDTRAVSVAGVLPWEYNGGNSSRREEVYLVYARRFSRVSTRSPKGRQLL